MRRLLGSTAARPAPRLRPFNDPRQIHALSDMGISVLTLPDGKVQLLYTTNTVRYYNKLFNKNYKNIRHLSGYIVYSKSNLVTHVLWVQ